MGSAKSYTSKLYFYSELIGICFLILLGTMFVTGVWQDIYWLMFPRPPVLSSREWRSSKTLYRVSESPAKTQQPDKVNYRYATRLQIGDSGSRGFDGALLIQETVWYADPLDAERAWDEPENIFIDENYIFFDREHEHTLTEFYKVDLPLKIDINSSLKCFNWDENRFSCVYFGYYEHWFTQIWFKSSDETILSQSQMIELIEKAVKILLEAPPPSP